MKSKFLKLTKEAEYKYKKMSFSEFWIQYKGNKIDLNKTNDANTPGNFDNNEKLQFIFNFFDIDGKDGLSEEEISGLYKKYKEYSNRNGNSIFDSDEQEDFIKNEYREIPDKNGNIKQFSLADLGVSKNDLVNFMKILFSGIGKFNAIPHEEIEAIEFLQTSVSEGEQTMEAHNDSYGVMSAAVNEWREIFSQRYTRSEAKANLSKTKSDVALLTEAAKKSPREFGESFERLRGVKFSKEAVEVCTDKSKAYASVKTTREMMETLKEEMGLTAGNAGKYKDASTAILNALNTCGIKDRSQIDFILNLIEQKVKNNPEFSKYGGNLRLNKTKSGDWAIYRNDTNGYPAVATPEQLSCVVKEICKMLDEQFVTAFLPVNKDGSENPEYQYRPDMSREELAELADKIENKYKTDYEDAFAEAYGGEDPAKFAQMYIEKEQQGVQYIQTGLNIAAMALMFIPGGALASAPGWLAKGVQTAKTVTPFLMVTHPMDFLEKWTSNGISKEEFEEWFMSCGESALFMGMGMGVSKVAESLASVYKTGKLVSLLKEGGRSVDDITAIIKSNPTKFPEEVVQSLKHIDNMSKLLQINTETALDLSTSYAMTKKLHGEGLTTFDWIQSVASAIAGGTLQKQFAPLSTEAKVKHLQDAFKEFDLSEQDALRILQEMDRISAGEYKETVQRDKPEMGLTEKPSETPTKTENTEIKTGKNNNIANEDISAGTKYTVTSENIGFTFDAAKNKYMINDERLNSIEDFINKKMDGDAFATKKCMENLVRTLSQDDINNINSMLNSLDRATGKRLLENPDELLLMYSNLRNSGFFKYGEITDAEWQVVQSLLDNPIQSDDLASLMRYKGTGYKNINQAMIDAKKNGTPIPEHLQTEIDNIERAIATQTVQQPLTVYRTDGMNALDNVLVNFNGSEMPLSEALQKCSSEDDIAKLAEYINNNNCTTTNAQFTSTSMFAYKKVGTNDDVKLVWELEVQPGSQGIYVEGVNHAGKLCKEREFIIQKNAKIEITGIEQDANGLWHIKGKVSTPQKNAEIDKPEMGLTEKPAETESKPDSKPNSNIVIADSKKKLYRMVKELKGDGLSKKELKSLFDNLDSSPEALTQYSMIIANLKKYGGGSVNFKDVIDFSNKKNIKLDELNTLFETMLNSVEKPEKLLRVSKYDDASEFLYPLSQMQADVSIEDLNQLVRTYTKYYGKIPNEFALSYITSTNADYVNYRTQLIEKYGQNSSLKDVVNPLKYGWGLIAEIKDAPNETTAIERMAILKEKVSLDLDFKESKILEISDDEFNKIILKLDIFLKNLNSKEKLDYYKSQTLIEGLSELNDNEFENITKRNLMTLVKNSDFYTIFNLAKLSDKEFAHFSERGLEINSKNIEFAKLTNKEWENFQNRGLQKDEYNNCKPAYLAKLNEDEWRIIEKYHLEAYPRLEVDEIKYLLEHGEAYIEKLQERKLLGFINRTNFDMADKFAKMSDEDFKNVKDRNLTSAIPNQQYKHGPKVYLSLEEIDRLRTLDDNQFKKVWDLLSIDRGKQESMMEGAEDIYFQPFRVNQAIELAQLSDAELFNLKQTGALNNLSMRNIRAFFDFQNYLNIKNYNDLTTADKKRMASLLVKHNEALFDDNLQKFIDDINEQSIIPKNQDEYCSLLRKAIRDSKIEVNPITKEQQTRFEKTITDMSNPNGAFLKTNFDADNFKLDLKYSRENFMKDVMDVLNGLSTAEKQKIMDYYGFEIYMKDGKFVMSGYPQVLKNNPDLNTLQGRKVAELVKKYTTENRIFVKDNPELSEMLNGFFDTFPELKGIIGKAQHETHSYTVDVHTLKVLQGVMSNPAFQKLSDADKKVISIATLMHDISKKEGEIDKQHPQNSATEAYQLIQKLDLSKEEKESIYEIIKYHDWLEKYNADNITQEERTLIAQYIAYQLKDGNNFQLAAMLTEADLKGVSKDNAFWNIYKDVFDEGVKEISAIVKEIKKNQIYIPQTHIPNASQLKIDGKIVTEEVLNGHRVKVLHLKKGQDLSKIGFSKGTMSDDIQLLYHGIISESSEDLELVLSCTEIDSDGVLSHSIISTQGQEVYSPYGIISFAPNSHLIAGSYYNIGSGYQSDKTIGNMINRYIFKDGTPSKERTYFSDKIKEKLNIGDDEYIALFDKISGMSLTELKQYNPKIGQAIEEVMYETDILRQQTQSFVFRGSANHISEILVHNIEEIQAIGCPYGKKYLDEIPEYFLKYAEENDIVIVSIED